MARRNSSTKMNPSDSYLSISNTVSSRASIPSQKLLLLDLNGTLLYRPKTRERNGKRPIHIRPYMSTFCSYLFHESVRMWLDVMVWSSAQPQNVDIMVTKCFGDHKSQLTAVWARDTLGLDSKSYNRKVQTLKDLEIPWKKLALPFAHTATSTLLMDDSPLKTSLQPHNHLCIKEYVITQGLWRKDRHAQKSKNTSESHHDCALLAAIGILEEIKNQTNVAGWLRFGGLWAGRDTPEDPILPLDEMSKLNLTCADQTSPPEPKPLWFNDDLCFNYWVDKGKETAIELGISLNPEVNEH